MATLTLIRESFQVDILSFKKRLDKAKQQLVSLPATAPKLKALKKIGFTRNKLLKVSTFKTWISLLRVKGKGTANGHSRSLCSNKNRLGSQHIWPAPSKDKNRVSDYVDVRVEAAHK